MLRISIRFTRSTRVPAVSPRTSSLSPITSRCPSRVFPRQLCADPSDPGRIFNAAPSRPKPPFGIGRPFADRIRTPNIRSSVCLVLFALACSGTASYIAAWGTTRYTWVYRVVHVLAPIIDVMREEFPPSKDGYRLLVASIRAQATVDKLYRFIAACNELPQRVLDVSAGPVDAAVDLFVKHFIYLTDGERIVCGVCIALGIISLSRNSTTVARYLIPSWLDAQCHDPTSTRKSTVLTSMFFHRSMRHLLAISGAIFVFGIPTIAWMISEQDNAPSGLHEGSPSRDLECLTSTAAGMFSAAASTIAFRSIGYRQLVSNVLAVSQAPPVPSLLFSPFAGLIARTNRFMIPYPHSPPWQTRPLPTPVTFGGSGVAYALATVSALSSYGHTNHLQYDISNSTIRWGVGSALFADAIGVILGWRRFDHWAHLGGAAFGTLYYQYGMQYWDVLRKFAWPEDLFQSTVDSQRDFAQEVNRKNRPEK